MTPKHKLVKKIRDVKEVKVPREQGVYALFLRGDVVYVGMSVSVFGRLNSHIKDKNFDDVFFFPVKGDAGRLKRVEEAFIKALDPLLNRASLGPPTHEDLEIVSMFVKGGAPVMWATVDREHLMRRRSR